MIQVCLSADSDCKRQVADVMFVVTSSMSVQLDNANGWSDMMNFVADFIEDFNIGSQATHVGVVA